jgi:hypothetical protein
MDIFARLLVRLAVWIRRPPSKGWLIAASIAIALSVLVVGLEAAGYWPESWTAERLPRSPGTALR